MEVDSTQPTDFDFETYRQKSETEYQKIRSLYEAFAERTKHLLREILDAYAIKVASIDARAKAVDSFGKKASTRSASDPNRPKYLDPLAEITDLAGVRVIAFFPKTLHDIDRVISTEFDVLERIDKADLLKKEERLGYQSVHYLVKLKPSRANLSEYSRFKGLTAEIQVRTILQHAWAEIEHDIQYKSVETIPSSIRRRFMTLAGLLEIADREFQAIQDEDEQLRQEARRAVQQGELARVEITPDALKAYLDKRLGSDGRMTAFSYDFTARLLRKLGFTNFEQIEECIANYDDDRVSKAVWGTRQGQLTRFEYQLLASMGENYIERHLWANEDWYARLSRENLEKMRQAGIPIGSYDPLKNNHSSGPVQEEQLQSAG